MMRRLRSNIGFALIASAIGLSGAASASDTAPRPSAAGKDMAPPATSSAHGMSTAPAATPVHAASTGAQTTSPGDQTIAPRGANPATTTEAMANGPKTADGPAKKIFDQLDTNKDGSLSLEEFSRATFQQPAAAK